MKSIKSIVTFLILVCAVFNIGAQNITPDSKVLYKEINGDSLYLHVFKPKVSKKPTAAIVFFFGGGWTGGNPKQFYQQSEYFASRGILAISAEYRIKNTHGTSPFECVEDGKSAIRWVRENAKKLNIDPNKIVASGGSAGGHVALTTALINGLENADENLSVSSVPNAVVAYNPVSDTTEKGYGAKKVAGRETEISPTHQVKKNMPPMLIFHGTKDKTVPFENAERFTRLMKEAGNECELVAIKDVDHGFFNGDFFIKGSGNKYYNVTTYKGNKYEVKNFGKGGATLIDGTTHPYFKKKEFKNSLKFTPDVVLIMFGTNDANVKWCLDPNRKTEFKGTAQEEFKSQYRKLIKAYKNKNAKAEIYVLTPLPIYEHEKSRDPKIKERIANLHEWVIPIVREVAESENVNLIDVNKLMKKAYKYTVDGVHLNQKGYETLAKKIAKEIQ